MSSTSNVRVGIMGLGTVGGGVAKILKKKQEVFGKVLGINFEISKVFSRRDHRLEELGLSSDLYTSDFETFINSPIDIVVEVIGGDVVGPMIEKALSKGLTVVTANKALLANHPRKYIGSKGGENLFFEASCCGGIPIISAFEEGLTATKNYKLKGIFNGTCNFILTKMEREKLDFSTALKEAQELGYAEADPTFDVEGVDATHKLCLLAALAFDQVIDFNSVYSEGISALSTREFDWANDHEMSIRLVSMAETNEEDELFLGTFPMMLPWTHPLSNVQSANNAVFLRGDCVEELLFSGPGAGEMPTASAVVSDIIAAAQGRKRIWSHHVFSESGNDVNLCKDQKFPFYIRMQTEDRAGVLASLCSEFATQDVSLRDVLQSSIPDGKAELIFTTHPQYSEAVNAALSGMNEKNLLVGKPLTIRILEI